MACIWSVICLCFIIAYLFHWYMKRPENYLEDLGIPYVRNAPFMLVSWIIRSSFSSNDINLLNTEIERYRKYGRIYGLSENGCPMITIADPDLLRKILAKDTHIFTGRRNFSSGDVISDNVLPGLRGEKWKRIRTIVTPAFSTAKIKRISHIIVSCAKTLVENFKSSSEESIDGRKFFHSFTMDVIASSAFGTKIESYKDPNNRFVQEASKFFSGTFSWRMIFLILFNKLATSLGIGFFDPKMVKFFSDTVLQIIQDRKKNGTVKNDFLQLLIDAEKEENVTSEKAKRDVEDEMADELGHDEENAEIFKPSKEYKSLSQDELLAQCLIFFIAGFDTITSTLSCACHELAVNPDMQKKLKQEIDEAISKNGNQLTFESIQDLKYLDCFVSETLRMYPPFFRVERVADEDYELEGIGITIKKGTIVSAPVYAMHHDSEFYPEPEKFRPERFSPEEKHSRHPYSYLTFGAGPRNCVGMRFALIEIKLCIAYLLCQLVLKKCPQTQIPLKISCPQGLLKPHAIFTVEKRKNVILKDDS